MTIIEFKNWILTTDISYRYQMLSRMQSDCLYFLGYGNGRSRLWGVTVDEHIEYMETLHDMLVEKPEWLTIEEIKGFKENMSKLLASKD